MYLIPIHVPIYRDGAKLYLTTVWQRSLELLRDSLGGHFGDLTVLAPWLPATGDYAQQNLSLFSEGAGIRLVPSFDLRCRAREFWKTSRLKWLEDLRSELPSARVVHSGLDDVYRPISYLGFLAGSRAGVPTVFVQDTDIALQSRQLAQTARQRLKYYPYAFIYERMCRHGVAKADLSLLKGGLLMERYAKHTKNPKLIHDTSHLKIDVIEGEYLHARLKELNVRQTLNFVYFGRLVFRKGVAASISILKRAKDLGAKVKFDIIGDGPELESLKRLVSNLAMENEVLFLSSMPYGSNLLNLIGRSYDALLFTPLAEDTPRMIFDGYAAGLPLVAFDIEYCKERYKEKLAACLLPSKDIENSAHIIYDLWRNRKEVLPSLASNAVKAGLFHCAENWYKRRADWTFEAVNSFKNKNIAKL